MRTMIVSSTVLLTIVAGGVDGSSLSPNHPRSSPLLGFMPGSFRGDSAIRYTSSSCPYAQIHTKRGSIITKKHLMLGAPHLSARRDLSRLLSSIPSGKREMGQLIDSHGNEQ